MSKKRDYVALQYHWNTIINLYIYTKDPLERMSIIDDFKDLLVDIDQDTKALRTKYENWEIDEWTKQCWDQLKTEIDNNTFQLGTEESKLERLMEIKRDNNYQRFRKILQLIQDSGIGLGINTRSKGAFIGPDDIDKYTGDNDR